MWFNSISATVNNGSTIVTINAGDDIAIIQDKSGLVFQDTSPVEVKRAYLDGSGNKLVELANPWPYPSKSSEPLVIYPTDASFAEATEQLRQVIADLQVATESEALSGTDDKKVMTPLKVQQKLDDYDSNLVVGTTGQSTEQVMSQKATTDAVNAAEAQILPTIQSFGIGTEWENLVGSYGYGFETTYNGGKYLINNPVDDATVAPPPLAGRTYHNFDGGRIDIEPYINLGFNYIIEFDFEAPSTPLDTLQQLIDGDLTAGRAYIVLQADGTFAVSGGEAEIDGVEVEAGVTKYPTDGLFHNIKFTIGFSTRTLNRIASRYSNTLNYQGKIYNLRVYNDQGEQIHSYDLRNDAVDTLGGNLIKDPEFTWGGNWELSSSTASISNNAATYTASPAPVTIQTMSDRNEVGTYRYIYDYDVTAGSIRALTEGTFAWDALKSGSGTTDAIVVHSSIGTGREGFICSSGTTATLKNLRVIKLEELSPSADFSSDVGFTLSGGVTIDTVNKQAVFGSGSGGKYVRFSEDLPEGTKVRVIAKTNGTTTGTYRIATSPEAITSYYNSDTKIDVEYTLTGSSIHFFFITPDGWDGNVEYFSVTKVTDGVPSGSINKTYEPFWKQGFIKDSVGVELNSYSLSTLPAATANARKQVWCSDLTGGAAPVYSNGTAWYRYSDNTQAN